MIGNQGERAFQIMNLILNNMTKKKKKCLYIFFQFYRIAFVTLIYNNRCWNFAELQRKCKNKNNITNVLLKTEGE